MRDGISERFSSMSLNLFCYTPNQKPFDAPLIGKLGLVYGAQELKQFDLYEAVYLGVDYFKNGIELSETI